VIYLKIIIIDLKYALKQIFPGCKSYSQIQEFGWECS